MRVEAGVDVPVQSDCRGQAQHGQTSVRLSSTLQLSYHVSYAERRLKSHWMFRCTERGNETPRQQDNKTTIQLLADSLLAPAACGGQARLHAIGRPCSAALTTAQAQTEKAKQAHQL